MNRRQAAAITEATRKQRVRDRIAREVECGALKVRHADGIISKRERVCPICEDYIEVGHEMHQTGDGYIHYVCKGGTKG